MTLLLYVILIVLNSLYPHAYFLHIYTRVCVLSVFVHIYLICFAQIAEIKLNTTTANDKYYTTSKQRHVEKWRTVYAVTKAEKTKSCFFPPFSPPTPPLCWTLFFDHHCAFLELHTPPNNVNLLLGFLVLILSQAPSNTLSPTTKTPPTPPELEFMTYK